MKKLTTYFMIFTLSLMVTSCVDDGADTDSFDEGPNIVGFSRSEINANALADGNTITVQAPVLVTGPTSANITNNVTVTVEIDPSSTAIQGTHFEMDVNSLDLLKSNSLEGSLPITIITTGVVPPLAVAPVLVLNLKTTSEEGTVISGRTGQVSITINYLCFSNLAGNYAVRSTRDDGSSWDQGIEAIVEVSSGYYKTITTGGWAAGTIAADQGFNFNDICNVLTVPDQGLAQNFYSNAVTGLDGGEVLANGDLVIKYKIDFSAGARDYSNSYIKQP